MNSLKLLLVGIGGYGDIYARSLLEDPRREHWHIEGIVDPYADKAPHYGAFCSLGIPVYNTIAEFYHSHEADLAVISTPIPLHESQAIACMEYGSHVLLEKPIAALPAAGKHIIRTAQETGRRLAIGFQWCYDPAMQKLRADLDKNLLGRPLRMRALVLWPRSLAYYARGTGWAGKRFDREGNAIYDSVASNATAHYLENMLWLAGNGSHGCRIAALRAETARANTIETYDTVTLRARLENGTDLTFVASHAIRPGADQEPMFEYEFEHGTVFFGGFGQTGSELTVRMNNGALRSYGSSLNGNDGRHEKIWCMMDTIREGAPIPCTGETAMCHLDAIARMRDVSPEAHIFTDTVCDGTNVYVPGLESRLKRCYEERLLLSETEG